MGAFEEAGGVRRELGAAPGAGAPRGAVAGGRDLPAGLFVRPGAAAVRGGVGFSTIRSGSRSLGSAVKLGRAGVATIEPGVAAIEPSAETDGLVLAVAPGGWPALGGG